MVGPTAQIAALTCHLNARKRGIATRRFFPDNSTCQFCEFVHFLREEPDRSGQNRQWDIVAATPDEWLDWVFGSAFSHATLVHTSTNDAKVSDRMLAGLVGGGGHWRLCLNQGERSECWEAGWQVGNRNATDQRIWRVRYALVEEMRTLAVNKVPLGELSEEMVAALTEIEAFARRQNLDGFADCFAKAESCLKADDPFALVYHRDLAPDGALALAPARLLAACQAAWVFGGMGSWNDLGFTGEDQELYERLSNRLFHILNAAICVAVNDTAASLL